MADLLSGSAAAVRAADVLLRCAGGRSVLLRMPVQASAGDETEQLGLAVPTFQDVELAPVVFRKSRQAVTTQAAVGKVARWELMVSASAVEALVGSLGYSAASVLFATAFGVLIDGVLMAVESVTESEVFGSPYVYRLVVDAPVALIV
jgi:phage-related minor tail protein